MVICVEDIHFSILWELKKHFNVTFTTEVKSRCNVTLTQAVPVIRELDGNISTDILHWDIPRVLSKDEVKEIVNTRPDKPVDRDLFAFAGVWNSWTDKNGK